MTVKPKWLSIITGYLTEKRKKIKGEQSWTKTPKDSVLKPFFLFFFIFVLHGMNQSKHRRISTATKIKEPKKRKEKTIKSIASQINREKYRWKETLKTYFIC